MINVVLFNMGGPSHNSEIYPFLKNLFSDKHIFPYPKFGPLIAKIIFKKSKSHYDAIGGKSPILEQTMYQAEALQKLNKNLNVHVAMSYSKPFIKDTFLKVLQKNPRKVVLIPLYPMYSTTTTLSCLSEWQNLEYKYKVTWDTKIIRSFFDHDLFIKAHVNIIKEFAGENDTLLFSAHSLPMSVIKKGDSYKDQVEKTVQLIMNHFKDRDYLICYQSKVGPVKWLEPSTEYCLKKCADNKKSVSIIPIAFISEHVETLFELDIEYRELFPKDLNYTRIKTLQTDPLFVEMLNDLTAF